MTVDSRASDLAVIECYDAHAGLLFGLASALLDDPRAAEEVVATVILTASVGADGAGADASELARLVYVRCERAAVTTTPGRARSAATTTRGVPTTDERAALALALFGRRDYRWIARVMTITPPRAAELLRSGLHRLCGSA